MSINSSNISLHDEKIVAWVNDPGRQAGDILTNDPSEEVQARGMSVEGRLPLPGKLRKVPILTAIRRHYRVERDGQPIADLHIVLPLKTTVEVSAQTVLGIDRGKVPAEAANAIVSAFNGYSPQQHGAVLQYMASLLADFNSKSPVKLSGTEFDFFTSPSYEYVQKEIDDSHDRWLHEVYEGDGPSLLPELFPERERVRNFGEKGYRLVWLGNTVLSEYPAPSKSENVISPEDNDTVEERAKKLARANDKACEYVPNVLKIRITSMRLMDDVKLTMEWIYYQDTKGCGFHMLGFQGWHRKSEKVLYVTVLWAHPLDALKKIFEDSARDAAELALATVLVFENFDAGLSTFKAVFWRLVKERARESLECLVPDMFIEQETGDWVKDDWDTK